METTGFVRTAAVCVALLLLFSRFTLPAVHAASITVDENCSLPDAIRAANTAAEVGGCAAGSRERDTLTLTADVILTAVDNVGEDGPNGLPIITGDVLIRGANFTITRAASAPAFRLFEVAPTGNLHLENVTLSNGLLVGATGGRGANRTVPGADGADGAGTWVFYVSFTEGEPGDAGASGSAGGAGGAGGSVYGGAIYNRGTVYLLETTLTGNTVRRGNGGGGGLCDIGAVEYGGRSSPAEPDSPAGGVYLSLPSGSFGRVIAVEGVFVESSAEIGSAELLARGVIGAVDIFSFGGTALGGEVCLRGTGEMFFLSATQSPRVPSRPQSYTRGAFTCATIPGDGTVVLTAGE